MNRLWAVSAQSNAHIRNYQNQVKGNNNKRFAYIIRFTNLEIYFDAVDEEEYDDNEQ